MKNNRSTFSILFYINKSKTKKSGRCPILGRISVDGKNATFSTGLDILPSEWSAKVGLAIGKLNDAVHLNKQIDNYHTEIRGHYKNMVNNNGYVTAESLRNALRGTGVNQNMLMQEFAELIDEKRKSIGVHIVARIFPMYISAYRHLRIL